MDGEGFGSLPAGPSRRRLPPNLPTRSHRRTQAISQRPHVTGTAPRPWDSGSGVGRVGDGRMERNGATAPITWRKGQNPCVQCSWRRRGRLGVGLEPRGRGHGMALLLASAARSMDACLLSRVPPGWPRPRFLSPPFPDGRYCLAGPPTCCVRSTNRPMPPLSLPPRLSWS